MEENKKKRRGAQNFIHSFIERKIKRITGFFSPYFLLSLLFNFLNPSDKFEINDNWERILVHFLTFLKRKKKKRSKFNLFKWNMNKTECILYFVRGFFCCFYNKNKHRSLIKTLNFKLILFEKRQNFEKLWEWIDWNKSNVMENGERKNYVLKIKIE